MCICWRGWAGDDCDVVCPGAQGQCSGHGKCTVVPGERTAKCVCSQGYGGDACEAACPLLFGKPCGCAKPGDRTCRGQCSSDGTCKCGRAYRGHNCGIMCLGGEGNTCSLKGECREDGSCRCFRGWAGAMCDVECPGGISLPCSGHGQCFAIGVKNASCSCDEGLPGLIGRYEGPTCSIAVYNPKVTLNQTGLGEPPWEAFQSNPWPAAVISVLTWLLLMLPSPLLARLPTVRCRCPHCCEATRRHSTGT